MDSTWGIFKGLLGPLTHDRSAYADGTLGFKLPFVERNAFFKVYTGLDHGDWHDAGGDQPDARCKQLLDTVFFALRSNMCRVSHPSLLPPSKSRGLF